MQLRYSVAAAAALGAASAFIAASHSSYYSGFAFAASGACAYFTIMAMADWKSTGSNVYIRYDTGLPDGAKVCTAWHALDGGREEAIAAVVRERWVHDGRYAIGRTARAVIAANRIVDPYCRRRHGLTGKVAALTFDEMRMFMLALNLYYRKNAAVLFVHSGGMAEVLECWE